MSEGLFKSVFYDNEMGDWFSGLLVTGWFGSAGDRDRRRSRLAEMNGRLAVDALI